MRLPSSTALLFPLLLCACGGGKISETGSPLDEDNDEDGFTARSDCDDEDPEVYPGANEVCNERDDDCDERVDDNPDDASRWYPDADGDGFGAETGDVLDCLGPAGTTTNAEDCDDGAEAINPDAAEICDGLDNNCDGLVDPDSSEDVASWYPDADGDGYGREGSEAAVSCDAPAGYVGNTDDCDDVDAQISPEADEICDEVDNDCNGATDPSSSTDAATWYADDDEDGYGDPDETRAACTQPSGYVADGTDCEPDDSEVSPGAPETCNGVDDDCDGTVDPPTSVDAPTGYYDADGDGFGDPDASVTLCSTPPGYGRDGTDCDDGDPAINPDAAELCDDADVDEDCDGDADDDDDSVTGTSDWTVDADGDGYGDETATAVSACEGPTGTVDNAEDCDDSDADRNPEGWPCTMELTTAAATAKLTGISSSDFAGYSLWADDYNLDGTPDYLVGAYYRSGGKGQAYVVFGPLDATGSLSAADVTLSDSSLTFVGYWTGPAGDLDGDGETDLAMLASKGGLYAYSAPVAAGTTLSSYDIRLTAEVSTDYLTTAAGGLDFNGDGADDMAVADGNWSSTTGAVYVALGPLAGSTSLGSADLILRGEASGDDAGGYRGLARAGDMDGDGLDDLFVGANDNDNGGSYSGAAYLVSGGTTGAVSLSDADAIISGTAANQYVGEAVSGNGDVDGDGYGDMLIGSTRYGSSYQGAVWLLSGPLSGETSISAATASLPGVIAYDYLGGDLGELGDLDGDGLGDLVVGALLDYSCGATTGTGSVYVLYGPVEGTLVCAQSDVIIAGTTTNGRFSRGIATPGDLDGDGLGDLFVGAYGEGAGSAYLIPGSAF